MQVKGISGESNWSRLPKLYARKDLPVNKKETAISERITKWEYLKPVKKVIVMYWIVNWSKLNENLGTNACSG